MSKLKLLLLSAFTSVAMNANSQTKVFTYPFGTDQRSIVALPNGNYAGTETTVDNSGRSDVHFVIYDQAGNLILDKLIYTDPELSIQNVDIEYYFDTQDGVMITLNRSNLIDPNFNAIELLLVDLNGTLINNVTLTSNELEYINLFPLDAEYDSKEEVFLICGSATARRNDFGLPFGPSLDKKAFLLQVDKNLSVINMALYNSTADQTEDYDIASRVKVTSSGHYYLMGSENVDKGLGVHSAGVRNMLVDKSTLATIWSYPIHMSRNTSMENSVDMLETFTNNGAEFIVLVNSTDVNMTTASMTAKWWIYRVDPNTGLDFYNNFETTGPTSYFQFPNSSFYCTDLGFKLHPGSKPGEVIVSGLKYPTLDRQCHTMTWGLYQQPAPVAEVVPFAATINVSNYPTTISSHREYFSLLTGTYWGAYAGGLYDNLPFGGSYYLVNHLGEFTDRLGPSSAYGMIAPVGSHTTKYLDINPGTDNGCDDVVCSFYISEGQMPPVYQGLDETEEIIMPVVQLYPLAIGDAAPNQIDDCSSGVYKTANASIMTGSMSNKITFYPNPVNDVLNIDFSSDLVGKDYKLKMEDITGKEIVSLSGVINKASFQVLIPGNVNNGLYYLVLQAGKNIQKEKILLNR